MTNDISLFSKDETLTITIAESWHKEKPTATIINYSGETVEKIYLEQGSNKMDISKYTGKNYAIRIQHGNNVVVQKI